MIKAKNIGYSIGNKFLVKDISLKILPKEFIVIMGANGAGKSTLLKMLAGSLQPTEGEILLDEKPLQQYSIEQLAVQRAVLSQHYNIVFPSAAKDIVMMGRYPYFNINPTAADERIVLEAMQQMQVDMFAERDYNTLSGGEAQKVQMARVLAQIGKPEEAQGKILFLDEPVSHLDIKYQHQLLSVAKSLCNHDVSVVAVLHDINLAIKYADRIVFMKNGILISELNHPNEITTSIIHEVFDVEAKILYTEIKSPIVLF
jgi:iron complex transport system ATP-binding protein